MDSEKDREGASERSSWSFDPKDYGDLKVSQPRG